jgi:ketosteroid isomerase-like protein
MRSSTRAKSEISHRFIVGAVSMILGGSLAACGGDPMAANQALTSQVTTAWVEAFNAGDAAALANLYAEDARSIPPTGGVITGRSGIESFWREDIGSGGGVTELTSDSSITQGDLLHVDGAYEVASKEGVVLGRGQYQQLWRRVDGQWKVQHEIWRLDPLAQRDASMAQRLQSLWTTAYNAGDAAGLTALYDQNAVLSTQPNGSVVGKDAIGAFWKADFGQDKPKTTLVLSDVYLAGDLAHLEGEYEVSEGRQTTKGHYVQLWMQSDNAWRIHREMWWQ